MQYSIENLFAIRKTKFKDHPGIIQELDLIEEEDKFTHNINIDDEIDAEDMLNVFKFDPFFDKTEEEWEQIKNEILGEEIIFKLKTLDIKENEEVENNEEGENEDEEDDENKIIDFTEKDLINLRRTIYLTIMNSLDFEECIHKLCKMNIAEGHEAEVKIIFFFY